MNETSQAKWSKEIQGFQKRSGNWQRSGTQIVKRYLDEREGGFSDSVSRPDYSLNLFHSNVETLQSMLYGSTPKVDVSREHQDPDDDVARVASVLYSRILSADIDPSGDGLPTVLRGCLQDRLLPGLGVARVRYKVNTTTVEDENGEEIQVFESEEAPVDYVHWTDFAWGWGRVWAEVPWVGFKNYLTKKECIARWGEDVCKRLKFKEMQVDNTSETQYADSEQKSVTQKAEIWEIWCKTTKKVYWFQEGQDDCLEELDDPLGLDGFFPVPKPMIANQTTRLVIPRADFAIAQDLYNQIDELYTRITIITRAIKVVGVYDQAAGDSVGRMLSEGVENDLIPVENWAMFAEAGGLKGKIDWFPAEQVVSVLQTLRQVLQEQIQLLYQVTGMADIMRGESKQYSGVGQEQLKAKFGSIRVQALQDTFARFASDLQELRAEVISKHFEMETIVKQSSAQYIPKADYPYLGAALELMKSPDVKWRVNIRPESIAMVDYQSLKAERTEYLMAIAQYIQSAQAMVREMPDSMPVLLEMMKWGVAGFKGANYLEGILDQAIQGATQALANRQQGQQQPSPEAIKAQTEQMKAQAMIQKEQLGLQKQREKAQSDLAAIQAKIAGEIQKITTDRAADQSTIEAQHLANIREIMVEFENDLKLIQANFDSDVGVEEAQAVLDKQINDQEHAHTMAEIAAQRYRNGR